MCQRAVCGSCRKVTYEGCGQHVEQVLSGVPADQRCRCEPGPVSVPAPAPVPMSVPARSVGRGGWWARLTAWMKSPA
ncbi:hypothetical protein C3489_28610 [Streptomyces sp. Ru71]|nr:hypothetical protein C3489_28610 [Streptomyces sp. Ru71]